MVTIKNRKETEQGELSMMSTNPYNKQKESTVRVVQSLFNCCLGYHHDRSVANRGEGTWLCRSRGSSGLFIL